MPIPVTDPAATERQQELKVLLKRWEAEFLRQWRRKPSQADIEEAPPETRRLYQEYRRLKKAGKTSESLENTSAFLEKTSEFSGQSGSPEIPKVEQVEDSGFWGSHLNRGPKIPGKSRSRNPRPGISAEFYGMKLKAKLGTTGKEPPLTPRRTPNPRRTPKIPQSQKTPEHGAAEPLEKSENSEILENPKKSENSEELDDLVLPPSVPGLGPLKFPMGTNPKFSPIPEKFQRLKEKVAKTLGSLDPGWIERCQEFLEKPKELLEKTELVTDKVELATEKVKFATEKPELATEKAKLATEKPELAKENPDLARENPEFPREKGEIHESVGNSARKRHREGGGAAEIPAKLRRRLQEPNPGNFGMRENLGIFGMGETQEDEGERPEFQSGAGKATKQSGKKLEKEEKSKAARRARAPPGNFVRLNLKRKTFSRGFQRGKFLRKQVWKQKWRKKFGGGGDQCFRCGGKGHWASECTGKDLGSFPEEIQEEPVPLPTLDEVAQRSSGVFIPEIPDDGSGNSKDFLQEFSPPPPPVDPLYSPNPDGTIPDPPEEVLEALKILGFDSFRPGQAEAIMRVLSGISTLVLLPTGTGKSLCYQLPAFLYHQNSGSISLVISPLVSLMDDQISSLPSALKAVCIHSNLTQSQRETAVKKVKSGQAQILLLSPEFLVASGTFSRFFRNFPPVAFACLDEAHCISQWSHNFRPAYLRICKVLRERLGVGCFLALTATATAATVRDIAQNLGIPPENGVGIGIFGIPKNLRLSVSMDPDRDQALLELLRGWDLGNFGNVGNFGNSVIVYCTRREESERLAALIQREFAEFPEKTWKNRGKGKKREFCVSAAYHAGLCPRERRKIQEDFMENRIRVLCATISFGMGLDKSQIRGIVHYNIPGNLESYVQEIGRAGRDGNPARCHLFLQPQGQDLLELRRHIHENSVDFLAVKTLIQRVFAPCKCLENHGKIQENSKEIPKNSRICRGHERSIPIQEFVESLDLREEGIETLLCLLELQPQKFLELFPPVHSRCRIRFPRNSTESLREAALRCPPLGFLLARNPAGNLGISGSLEFDAVALSDSMGWEFRRVRESLGRIPWESRKAGKSRIQVEFWELSFHFRAYGDLDSQELDSNWEFLNSQIISREKSELRRLQRCFRTFQSVAFPSFIPEPPEQEQLEKNSRLRELLREYFQRDPTESEEDEEEKNPRIPPDQEEEIRAEIRKFLAAYPEEEFSGRAVARIFHGIGSPRFPARIFGRDRRFWRRLLPLEFRSLSRLASQEILAWR